MLESTFLFVGTVALITTIMALLTPDDAMAIITGVSGFLSWGLIAYGSLDVQVVGDSTTFTFTQPSVTVWAIVMALIPAYIALTGPTELVNRFRQPSQQNL